MCCTGINPVICKCSLWESKDWKLQCHHPPPPTPIPIPCSLLSSLTASLIHSKRLLSKSSWVTADEQDPIIFYILLMLVSCCFFAFEKEILLLQRQSVFVLDVFPKQKDLWLPWDVNPDLVSRYQQVELKEAAQASLPNLICYLLSSLKWPFSSALPPGLSCGHLSPWKQSRHFHLKACSTECLWVVF